MRDIYRTGLSLIMLVGSGCDLFRPGLNTTSGCENDRPIVTVSTWNLNHSARSYRVGLRDVGSGAELLIEALALPGTNHRIYSGRYRNPGGGELTINTSHSYRATLYELSASNTEPMRPVAQNSTTTPNKCS
jgi:hypothetical protein